jgi:hypothetical protein
MHPEVTDRVIVAAQALLYESLGRYERVEDNLSFVPAGGLRCPAYEILARSYKKTAGDECVYRFDLVLVSLSDQCAL